MTINTKIPLINNQFVCILNLDDIELGAIICSYFPNNGTYLPLFLFPKIDKSPSTEGFESDGYLSLLIGAETAVLLNNAIVQMGGCKKIIFAGLNKHQKKHIQKFLKIPIIEINSIEEVDKKMKSIITIPKKDFRCKGKDILSGLFEARRQGLKLIIDEEAEDIKTSLDYEARIVIVEKDKDKRASPLIAVNYALSISASLQVVEEIPDNEINSIKSFIQKWKSGNHYNQLQKVLNKIKKRVGHIDFRKYKFATFFTNGIPYSLGFKNVIPSSYVHLSLRPDLFVYNTIGFETSDHFHSAVVFSPTFFDDEETGHVIEAIRKQDYYLRPLIGKYATVYNLTFHAEHFPYDLFHICSHGGEVNGYEVKESFIDRKGAKHIIEYDEVVGFAIVPGKDLIKVHEKTIFRKFDGFKWMSPELREQKIPNYVFEDMRKLICRDKKDLRKASRIPKKKISTSCAIACIDSIHQGMFRILASHTSPVVFNNTCWSWGEISHFFLSAGARGYVGTLWAIENNEAVIAAKEFYSNAFQISIAESIYKANNSLKGTSSEDIYMYWGLHFSTLSSGVSLTSSRHKVFEKLLKSLFAWLKKVNETESVEVKRNSQEIIRQIYTELMTNFTEEDMRKFQKKIGEKIKNLTKKEKGLHVEEKDISIQERMSIDHPIQYRRLK